MDMGELSNNYIPRRILSLLFRHFGEGRKDGEVEIEMNSLL